MTIIRLTKRSKLFRGLERNVCAGEHAHRGEPSAVPGSIRNSRFKEWQRRNRDAHSLQLARVERFPRACVVIHPRRDALPKDVLGQVGWELAHDRLEPHGVVLAGTFTALLRFLSSVFGRGGHQTLSGGEVVQALQAEGQITREHREPMISV